MKTIIQFLTTTVFIASTLFLTGCNDIFDNPDPSIDTSTITSNSEADKMPEQIMTHYRYTKIKTVYDTSRKNSVDVLYFSQTQTGLEEVMQDDILEVETVASKEEFEKRLREKEARSSQEAIQEQQQGFTQELPLETIDDQWEASGWMMIKHNFEKGVMEFRLTKSKPIESFSMKAAVVCNFNHTKNYYSNANVNVKGEIRTYSCGAKISWYQGNTNGTFIGNRARPANSYFITQSNYTYMMAVVKSTDATKYSVGWVINTW